jgi:hypothetical protein
VDKEYFSRDRLIPEKLAYQQGNFSRFDQTADGDIVENFVQGLNVHPFDHGGGHVAGCNRNTADAARQVSPEKLGGNNLFRRP